MYQCVRPFRRCAFASSRDHRFGYLKRGSLGTRRILSRARRELSCIFSHSFRRSWLLLRIIDNAKRSSTHLTPSQQHTGEFIRPARRERSGRNDMSRATRIPSRNSVCRRDDHELFTSSHSSSSAILRHCILIQYGLLAAFFYFSLLHVTRHSSSTKTRRDRRQIIVDPWKSPIPPSSSDFPWITALLTWNLHLDNVSASVRYNLLALLAVGPFGEWGERRTKLWEKRIEWKRRRRKRRRRRKKRRRRRRYVLLLLLGEVATSGISLSYREPRWYGDPLTRGKPREAPVKPGTRRDH